VNQEEHRRLLAGFEVDRLLKILAIEAKKHSGGHFSIFSFTTHYKVAFGTPDLYGGAGYDQLKEVRGHKKLKDAVIDALVEARDFHGHVVTEPFDIRRYLNQ
jgi:hypothetical protein